MKLFISLFATLLLSFVGADAFSAQNEPVGGAQGEFERDISAVVRNKRFYKSGHIEITPLVGVMPYDSTVAHFSVGGRLHWHLSDHLGWEVGDIQMMFPSVTDYTRSLVQARGMSNVQVLKIKQLFATSLLFSPVYGKIRFFGDSVVHFDLYMVFGVGMANTDSLRLSSSAPGIVPTETIMKAGMDPMFSFGLGAKFFVNRAMGLVLDLRDYVINGELYGGRALRSNYSVFVGLSLFLPTF